MQVYKFGGASIANPVQMQQLVKEAMENAVQLTVPMEVEMKLAANWLEAH